MSRNLLRFLVVLTLFLGFSVSVQADMPAVSAQVSAYLPDRVGNVRALQAARVLTTEYDPSTAFDHVSVSGAAARTYVWNGSRFDVRLFATESESAAYALLTGFRNELLRSGETLVNSGLAEPGYVLNGQLVLAKGKLLVHIVPVSQVNNDNLVKFAGTFSEKLPRGEDVIPVLVKHLPKWESEPREVSYFVNIAGLKNAVPAPVFESLTFDGAEAAVAAYGQSQLVLIEFPTPQLATQNDEQVLAKLQELRNQNQNLPTLYRRVGNYGLFVFNGDEATAKTLADEVKYEQVTKWLGENPYPLLEAQRRYTITTLGVLVSVVKASGIALVVCLTAGGLFGGLLFLKRRSQQRTVEAYSDAGGMLRLNLDEMTPQTDPARLLGK